MHRVAGHTYVFTGGKRSDDGDTNDLQLSRTPAGQTDPGTLYSGYRSADVDDLARPLYLAHDPTTDCPEPGGPGSCRVGSLGVLPGALGDHLRRKGRRAR